MPAVDLFFFFKLSEWFLSLCHSHPLPSPFAQSCNILFIPVPRALHLTSVSVLCSTLCGNIRIILFCFFGREVWFPDRDLQLTLLVPHPTLSVFTSLVTENTCDSPPGQGASLQVEPEASELVTLRAVFNPLVDGKLEDKNFLTPG